MMKGLSQATAARHFNVMHHMMGKAAAIWSKETGIERNPTDAVEVKRPDDQRERYLDAGEIGKLKATLDEKMYRKAGKVINQTFFRLRLIVLVALTTGMRIAEIFCLKWNDLLYREGAERRQSPVCSDAVGTRWGVQTISGHFRGGANFPPRAGCQTRTPKGGSEFRDHPRIGWDRSVSISRSPAYVRELVHDERWRFIRTGQDSWSRQHQDDGALCQTLS